MLSFSRGPCTLSFKGWIKFAWSSSHRSIISAWTFPSKDDNAREHWCRWGLVVEAMGTHARSVPAVDKWSIANTSRHRGRKQEIHELTKIGVLLRRTWLDTLHQCSFCSQYRVCLKLHHVRSVERASKVVEQYARFPRSREAKGSRWASNA